jgi:hypothetical protein
MYLEVVIVCVDYADFLIHTLPQAKLNSNHVVVVTTPTDKETQSVCAHHNVECLRTNAFYENGDPFNKAKGINEGLAYLSKRGWVLHIDADVYLPAMTRSILERKDLDPKRIYGADRLMCPDFESWVSYNRRPKPIHDSWTYVHLNAFPIASRIADYNGDCYAPIGYFQLWNPGASGVTTYPDKHGAADRTDMLFAKLWQRGNRELLPEVVVVHLDSEDATVKRMGANWNGRKTLPFEYGNKRTVSSWRVLVRYLGWTLLGAAVAGAAIEWQTLLGLFGR